MAVNPSRRRWQRLDRRLRLRVELGQRRFQVADAAAERIVVGGDCVAQELQQLAPFVRGKVLVWHSPDMATRGRFGESFRPATLGSTLAAHLDLIVWCKD